LREAERAEQANRNEQNEISPHVIRFFLGISFC